jgi:hypothetical protein
MKVLSLRLTTTLTFVLFDFVLLLVLSFSHFLHNVLKNNSIENGLHFLETLASEKTTGTGKRVHQEAVQMKKRSSYKHYV